MSERPFNPGVEGGADNITPEERLGEVKEKIKYLEERLIAMEGDGTEKSRDSSEMRQILDREWKLKSAQSPVSATDPNRRTEYQGWLDSHEDSKRATAELKRNLEDRIAQTREELKELKAEEREIEQQLGK